MKSHSEPEYFYRFEDTLYAAPLNEYDEPVGSSTLKVELRKYLVSHHTKCGTVIYLWTCVTSDKRFIRRDANKRFALPTIEEAAVSFYKRKERQNSIYIARARTALDAMKHIVKGYPHAFSSAKV